MGHINPEIAWRTLGSRACLKFTFNGHLTVADTERAILEWRRAFHSMEYDTITIIWDCLKMEGYDHKARSEWTHALVDMKAQIAAVWLITKSPIIKMGATVMGMFSGLNIQIVKSEADIPQNRTPLPMHFLDEAHQDERKKKPHDFRNRPE